MNRDGTAWVTGASSGIGEAFTRCLAARGHDLVLVARRGERLAALAAELRERHAVSVETLVADLAAPADIERIEKRIGADDRLELLINNAGFGTTGHFVDNPVARHVEMVTVHVVAPVRLCHAALVGMIARGRGAVVNVASISAFLPFANNVTYAATKRYLVTFTEALHHELKGTGVRVQALCPGFTYTEFHDTEEFASFDRGTVPGPFWMSAEKVAAASLDALRRDRPVFIPGFRNRMLVFLFRSKLTALLPVRRIRDRVLRKSRP